MYRINVFLTFFLFLFTTENLESQTKTESHNKDLEAVIEKIIRTAKNDTAAYKRLEYLCDVFGPRLSGSEALEQTLQWMQREMIKDGFQNVRKEEVMVPHWVRRSEKCELIYPRKSNVPVFALGGSIGTPKEGITAPIIVVSSFDELEKRKDEVKGKIVVYNFKFESYGKNVQYRFHGAVRAAKYGAVASLIRSVSPNIMRNLHTGMMAYDDTIPKIPHAAISPEDAMLFARLISYGFSPMLKLEIDCETLPDAPSGNIIAEFKSEVEPEQIIALGGHTDSWDAGTGAHDDAGGCIVTWEAVKLLKKLGIKPQKTIRLAMWTNEENGVRGGKAYRDNHKDEKHVLMFEHDSGVFPPSAIKFSGPDTVFNTLKEYEPYLKKINPSLEFAKGGGGVDIDPMVKTGVAAMSLSTNDDGKYFYYHHSHSDTPDKVKREDLNDCIAAVAVAIYLASELHLNF